MPGQTVTPHHHRQTEEIYYVLEGRGLMTVGDEQSEVASGDAIFVPREHRHTLTNTGTADLRLILVCGPAFLYEDEVLDSAE